MTREQAIATVSAYAPCTHESHEVVGTGRYRGRCDDCNNYFALDQHERIRQNARNFQEALEVLRNAPAVGTH